MYEGKIVGSQLVVARCNATALFDLVEETLDPVALTVEIGTEVDRIAAIAFWWDIGSCASPHGELSDPVGVIAAVGK